MGKPHPDLDRLLHAIADPTRRRILEALKHPAPRGKTQNQPLGRANTSGCLCAGDIEEHVRLSQPTISHHMTILTKAGLVEAVKQGQWRWYRRDQTTVRQLLKVLRRKL